jgi:hypothetical protein
MFNRNIEFSAHEDYYKNQEDFPIPAKMNIPEWYKKLEHSLHMKTVKGCMPFLDTLTAGYLLKMPQDFYINHNVYNEELKIQDSFHKFSLKEFESYTKAKRINLNTGQDIHSKEQLLGSPFIEKNKNLPFYKILNPWKIKTPKGYSCLFVSPLNNSDDRFSIIPGIVDTDVFPTEINFPIIINGDKYPTLETIIKKGLPYVQVVPFKRERWKMSIKSIDQNEVQHSAWKYEGFELLNKYKENFWNKKSWK